VENLKISAQKLRTPPPKKPAARHVQ
jgi:hypothetical protein